MFWTQHHSHVVEPFYLIEVYFVSVSGDFSSVVFNFHCFMSFFPIALEEFKFGRLKILACLKHRKYYKVIKLEEFKSDNK
jgi:hypothetical protein